MPCRAHAVHMQRSFENLKLTSTKKRCECECEYSTIAKTFSVFNELGRIATPTFKAQIVEKSNVTITSKRMA